MTIDELHPLDQGVLRYLHRDPQNYQPLAAPPDSVKKPYYNLGSHPDVVERVWDQLGGSLPSDCRWIVYGTPVLAHVSSGVIFAICNGTQYNLRLTPADYSLAIEKGIRTTNRWSDGSEMDARETLGENWVFGGWLQDEIRWCKNILTVLEGEIRHAK